MTHYEEYEHHQDTKLLADEVYCQICGENYSNKIIKICCEYCPMTCCRICSETFILGQNYPHCMDNNCKKTWTRKFMVKTFTNDFMNKKYKKHREQILFEQEQSLLPETQLLVEREKYKNNEIKRIEEKCQKIDDEIYKLRMKRLRCDAYYNELKNDEFTVGIDTSDDNYIYDDNIILQKNNTFIHKCSNEDCRGFISSRWKCSLCETWTCNKCFVNMANYDIKEQHICKENDLATAKLIKSDCKPCPKCSVSIFKIEGCDQMFCTNCHTPFSWKTEKIYTGKQIHNPHYFEYIKQNSGTLMMDIQENNCHDTLNNDIAIRLCTFSSIMRTLYYDNCSERKEHERIFNDLICITRNIVHLNYVFIDNLNTQINNHEKNNQTDRIKYMTHVIDEDSFKKNIQINEKKKLKNEEYLNLYIMVRDTATDLILHFHNTIYEHYKKDTKLVLYSSKLNLKNDLETKKIMPNQLIAKLENLRCYANECLNDISKTYKSVKKEFDMNYNLINCKKNV